MVARRQVVELGALPEWLSVSHPGLGGWWLKLDLREWLALPDHDLNPCLGKSELTFSTRQKQLLSARSASRSMNGLVSFLSAESYRLFLVGVVKRPRSGWLSIVFDQLCSREY